MSDIVTLLPNYQIAIPKKVRESQNWKRGQQFAFIPKDGGYLLVPAPDDKTMFGIAKGANTDNYRDRKDRY